MRDPSFLFYSDNFLMGCADLTMEERGQYITLLCIHHQKGFLTRKSIGLCLGFDWDSVSEDLRSKFIEKENGEIYNERLVLEMEKRRRFSEKQRENGLKGGRPTENKKAKDPKTKTQNKPKINPNLNPKESLLVNEIENENEEEIINDVSEKKLPENLIEDKIKKYVNEKLEMPDSFRPLWADWCEYRKAKKKKPYASLQDGTPKYEQMAVNKFIKHSEEDPIKGADILEYSFYKNYEGFFAYSDIKPQINKMKQEKGSNGNFETNR